MLDLMKPPPCLSQSISTGFGILSFTQRVTIRINRRGTRAHEIMGVLGNLRESAERFGSDNRQNKSFPKVMFNPVQAENDERDGLSQCEKRSKPLKRTTFLPSAG